MNLKKILLVFFVFILVSSFSCADDVEIIENEENNTENNENTENTENSSGAENSQKTVETEEVIENYDKKIIRVALVHEIKDDNIIEVEFSGSHQIVLDGKIEKIIDGSRVYVIKKLAGEIAFYDKNNFNQDSPNFIIDGYRKVIESADKNALFRINKSYYRGGFSIYIGKYQDLVPINEIDLESYLYGVVPAEIPASSGKEALKAQAICARTYAYRDYLDSDKNSPYNLYSDTRSQVYRGYDSEYESTNIAVDETKNMFLTYNDELISTFYSADNGGYSAEFGSEDSYLFKAKVDPYTAKVTRHWDVEYSPSELSNLLAAKDVYIGDIQGMRILERNKSGRVSKLEVVGTNGSKILENGQIRAYLGYVKMMSNKFDYKDAKENLKTKVLTSDGIKEVSLNEAFVLTGDGLKKVSNDIFVLSQDGEKQVNTVPDAKLTFEFSGTGFGHGVGMSQVGAMQMADEGLSYKDILNFYYEGTEIKKF